MSKTFGSEDFEGSEEGRGDTEVVEVHVGTDCSRGRCGGRAPRDGSPEVSGGLGRRVGDSRTSGYRT